MNAPIKATEETSAPTEAQNSNKKLKLIIIILALLLFLVAGGGIAAYFFILKPGSNNQQATPGEGEHAAEPAQSTPEHTQPANQKHAPDEHKTTPPVPHLPHMTFYALDPLTVNLSTPGPVKFLRISIVLATQFEPVIAAVQKNLPVIRNDLLIHLSTQQFTVLNQPEGKDALRVELNEVIAKILARAGEPSRIDFILFPELIMQ